MTPAELQAVRERVTVGSRVVVNAQFTPLTSGVVEEVYAGGYKVAGLWFGWHELVSAEPSSREEP